MTHALQKVLDLVGASRLADLPLALPTLPLHPPDALGQAALRGSGRSEPHSYPRPRPRSRTTRTYVERHPVLAQVLARDGWICWYCGGAYADEKPWRVSIEHLIPRSAGGPKWDPDNIVLAHSHCNSVAGDHELAVKLALRDALRAAAPRTGLSPAKMIELGVVWGRRQNRELLRQIRRQRVKDWKEHRRRRTLDGLYQPIATLGEVVGALKSANDTLGEEDVNGRA